MLRIAVHGIDSNVSAYLTAAERLPHVDCAGVAGNSRLEQFNAAAFAAAWDDDPQRLCETALSGRHLIVDLELLRNVDEIDAVINASRDADVRLMIGQPLRFLPSIQTIKQCLDEGKLGEPGLLRIHRWVCGGAADVERLLIRELDLANWLFGQMPSDVYAVAHEIAGCVQVHLGIEGGGMTLIDVTTRLPQGDDYYSLSLIGGDGSAYADDHHNAQLLYCGGATRAERTREDALALTAHLREFAAAIDESREPAVDGSAARDALQVAEAVRISMESKCVLHRQRGRYEVVQQ